MGGGGGMQKLVQAGKSGKQQGTIKAHPILQRNNSHSQFQIGGLLKKIKSPKV
jgi:hypothetical protein